MIAGLSSFAFRNKKFSDFDDVKKLFWFASENQIELIQLADNVDLHFSDHEFEELSEIASNRIKLEFGFKVHSYEQLIEALKLSSYFKVHRIRLVISDVTEENCFLYNHRYLDSICSILSDSSISIMLENHIENNPMQFRNLILFLHGVSDRFSVCFDCFNSLFFNVSSFECYELLKDYISEVHVKDVCTKRIGLDLVFSGCEFGTGIFDCQHLIRLLVRNGASPDFPVIIESWNQRKGISENEEFELVRNEIIRLKEIIVNEV